jgi:hypothetical protein
MINGNACFADFNKNWGISGELLDVSTSVRLSSLASFSSLAFKVGLTLKFSCALRAIIAGLIRSLGNTMYYKTKSPVRGGSDGYGYS